MEWSKQTYNSQYEKWMPWIEDNFLSWFTKDNKASYAAKQNLDKTKVTGISQVDTLQDGVNNVAAGQVGQGGLLQPVGDAVSKEGINRTERGGRDNGGGYLPSSKNIPGSDAVSSTVGSVAEGGKGAVGKVGEGLGGLTGLGGKKEDTKQQK